MLRSLIGWLLFITLLWFVPWVPVLYTGLVVYFPYEPNGHDRFARVSGPALGLFSSDPDWTAADQITQSCKSALVAAEDARFFEHNGFDPDSIEQAMLKNAKSGKPKWGGSTITQQLVKNVFLSREKTYLRKVRELTGAVLLDLMMSKDRQLNWYFNVVEFGPNVYGIKQAAQYYFHKKPKGLSLSECVSLVAVLPDPNRSHRSVKNGNPSARIQKRYAHIMRALGR